MSALKRQAVLAQTATSAPTTVIAPRKRLVVFHLTPWAPGCEMKKPSDPARCYEAPDCRPGQALRALCKRLEIGAKAIALTGMVDGTVAVHPIGQPEAPWAFIWRGMTFDEASTALAMLATMQEAGL